MPIDFEVRQTADSPIMANRLPVLTTTTRAGVPSCLSDGHEDRVAAHAARVQADEVRLRAKGALRGSSGGTANRVAHARQRHIDAERTILACLRRHPGQWLNRGQIERLTGLSNPVVAHATATLAESKRVNYQLCGRRRRQYRYDPLA